MHKDPPPGLLERPPKVIILYGLLTGFVAGIVVIGTWSLFSTGYTPLPKSATSIEDRVK